MPQYVSLRKPIGYSDALLKRWNEPISVLRDDFTPGNVQSIVLVNGSGYLLPKLSVIEPHLDAATWLTNEDRETLRNSRIWERLRGSDGYNAYDPDEFLTLQLAGGDRIWEHSTWDEPSTLPGIAARANLRTGTVLSTFDTGELTPLSLMQRFHFYGGTWIPKTLANLTKETIPVGPLAYLSNRLYFRFTSSSSTNMMLMAKSITDETKVLTGDAWLCWGTVAAAMKVDPFEIDNWVQELAAIDAEPYRFNEFFKAGISSPKTIIHAIENDIDIPLLHNLTNRSS
jgi:hypothetical protein